MKIFFAGVFHHFSNWLLNLRAASCDASSKMKTFVGNNFQLSLSQHDFSLWWIEDLLLGVFSDMEDWKGQILWILKKIKFFIEYYDKWIALLLGFEINSIIHFMKWNIHLHWQDVFIPMWIFSFVLFSKINALQCIIYLRCIYHIYFAEEKKWTKKSEQVSLYCCFAVYTPSIKWPSDIFNDHNGIGNCLQKIEFGDFLGEGIVLCHIFMNQAKQRLCQVDTSLCFSLFCLNLINPS